MMTERAGTGQPSPIRPSEQGYMLLAAIFLLALFMISLSVALPKIAKEIQRDREVETMERGKQYIRGIKMYYKKFGRYPPNVDALVKTNEIRFLRKKYVDPTTGKEDWKPVQFGQNKAPTAMGFFGQPLAGAMSAGSSCNGIAGASTVVNGTFTSATGGATDVSAGSNIGNCDSTTSDNSAAAGATGTAGSTGSTGSTGTTGTTFGQTATGSSSGANGIGGQTIGGAGIIGFSPNSPKPSILVYKKKNHYNQWEFVYDPAADQMMIPGGGGVNGANPANPTNTTGAGITGAGTTGGGFGSNPISNTPLSAPNTPPATTTPPQQ